MSGRVETKTLAAGGGALGGGAVSPFVLWLLGIWVWGVPNTAGRATDAIAAVPLPVSTLVLALVPALLGLLSAYLAPHTHRPDLAPPKQDDPELAA